MSCGRVQGDRGRFAETALRDVGTQCSCFTFFFQAEDGIRDGHVTEFRRVLFRSLFKTGPLASNVCEAGGFLKTKSDLPAPDLQLNFGPAFYVNHGFTRPTGHGFSVGPSLIRPRSRGRIALLSCDPLEPPLIQPNYFLDDADRQVLVESVALARRIARAKAFDAYRGAEVLPGEQAQSEKVISEYVCNIIETQYHPVGTCKMGSDPMAVVDARLQVRG